MKNQVIKKVFRSVTVLIFWLAVWEVCALAVGKAVVLPSPFAVMRALWNLLGKGSFYLSCLSSLLHIFAGLVLGVLTGVLLAFATKSFKIIDAAFSPALEVIKATPVASFILVLLFIFTKNVVPVLAAFLMVIPIIFMNVRKGLDSVSKEKQEVAQMFGFGLYKRMKLLTLPSVMPYFYAGCKSALALSWKAGIAAEVICTPASSIGTMLYSSKIYLESEELFALTAVIIILSILIEKGFLLLFSKIPGIKGVIA